MRTARPPPSSSAPSPLTRRMTASGPNNGCALRGGDPAVQGGALFERATEWFDDGPEAGLVHHLAVLGAGGTGDVFVDERAAKVVDARLQQLLCARRTHLHPAHLDVV